MSVIVQGMSVPNNCFRCPLAHWYDSGFVVGFTCGAIRDAKVVSNCEGRSRRRDDCPLKEVDG